MQRLSTHWAPTIPPKQIIQEERSQLFHYQCNLGTHRLSTHWAPTIPPKQIIQEERLAVEALGAFH
jgi:hypothetical protein